MFNASLPRSDRLLRLVNVADAPCQICGAVPFFILGSVTCWTRKLDS